MRKPKLGQNFLVDDTARHAIADSLGDVRERTVLEIGPGHGAITSILAERCRRLIAIEVDRALAAELRFRFREQPQVEIVEADVLAVDFAALLRAGETADVVGNLPYYITSEILLRLFAAGSGGLLTRTVVMMQREVADRVAAAPGQACDYGLLSRDRADECAGRDAVHVAAVGVFAAAGRLLDRAATGVRAAFQRTGRRCTGLRYVSAVVLCAEAEDAGEQSARCGLFGRGSAGCVAMRRFQRWRGRNRLRSSRWRSCIADWCIRPETNRYRGELPRAGALWAGGGAEGAGAGGGGAANSAGWSAEAAAGIALSRRLGRWGRIRRRRCGGLRMLRLRRLLRVIGLRLWGRRSEAAMLGLRWRLFEPGSGCGDGGAKLRWSRYRGAGCEWSRLRRRGFAECSCGGPAVPSGCPVAGVDGCGGD